MSQTPFFKLYTSDWRDGTKSLSFEAQGFYARAITLMWDAKGGISADRRKLAVAMQCDPRTAERLRDTLVAAGKFTVSDGLLVNARILIEISEHQRRSNAATQRELSPKLPLDIAAKSGKRSAGSRPEVTAKKSENTAISKNGRSQGEQLRSQKSEVRDQKEAVVGAAPDAHDTHRGPSALATDASNLDSQELFDRLSKAAGNSLSPLAIGLQSLGEPLGWLNSGADLELDVLPVVKFLSQKAQPGSIRSWRYYASAVSDAKHCRERGLPPPSGFKPQPDARAHMRRFG